MIVNRVLKYRARTIEDVVNKHNVAGEARFIDGVAQRQRAHTFAAVDFRRLPVAAQDLQKLPDLDGKAVRCSSRAGIRIFMLSSISGRSRSRLAP